STSTAHRDNVQLRLYSPLVDGSANLPGLSLSDSNVTIPVPNSDDCSESLPFASVSLFLNEADSQDLLLNVREQRVNDLWLLDPHALSKDLLHRHDLACLDELSKLCLRDPSYLLTRSLPASLIGSLAHAFASIGADWICCLTCSKWLESSSGFKPRFK